jgi:hypothetical protein
MKVIRIQCCKECKTRGLECDGDSPTCSQCAATGRKCSIRLAQRMVAAACDRCRSKKIRCDGIKPQCSHCANLGFECKTTNISRTAFPRGYTESLEERVRALEAEEQELKDLLDVKNERVDTLVRAILHEHSPEATNGSNKPTAKFPTESSHVLPKALHMYTFEIERHNGLPGLSATKQSIKKTKISKWVHDTHKSATESTYYPAIKLLVVDTPADPEEDRHGILPLRQFHEDIQTLAKPMLEPSIFQAMCSEPLNQQYSTNSISTFPKIALQIHIQLVDSYTTSHLDSSLSRFDIFRSQSLPLAYF